MQLLQHFESIGSSTMVFPNPVRAGSLLLVFTNCNGGVIACTDTVGTVYTAVFNTTFATGDQCVVMAGLAGGSGANTVTGAFLGTGLTGSSIAEFCGAGTTIDITTTNPGALTISGTTTVTGDLVIAFLGAFHHSAITVNSPFTPITPVADTYVGWGYIPDAAIGTYTETFTVSTTPYDAFMIAFKASGGTACSGPSYYVTGKSLTGPSRNNEAEGHGAQIAVAGSDIWVTDIGRNFVTGNTASHRLYVMANISATNLLLGYIDVPMLGGVNGSYTYGTLPIPIKLSSGVTYWIVSKEVNGGDNWLDYSSSLTTTLVATLTRGGLHLSNVLTGFGSAGNCYVPVDFKYLTADPLSPFTVFTTSQTLGTNRTSFSDFIGMKFYATANANVYSLGRWCIAGSSKSHTLSLVDSSNSLLGSCVLNMTGKTAGAFAYADFASPVAITAGSQYYVYSGENTTDHFYDSDTVVYCQNQIGYGVSAVWSNNIAAGPTTDKTAADSNRVQMQMYGPLDLALIPLGSASAAPAIINNPIILL